MKKNYLKIKALAALAVLGTVSMSAQVATLYSFTQVSGTYSAATTGGTVFGYNGADDNHYVDPSNTSGGWTQQGPGIDIGFTFMFNNHSYDRVAFDDNGFMTFGSSALSPQVDCQQSYNLISDYSGAAPIQQDGIAAVSCDLYAWYTTSNIRAVTLGSAPTRTFIIQWTDYGKYYSGSGDHYNFQIRLMETTNIVEIQYDLTSNSNSTYPQVGLRGDANTDFNNRDASGGTSTWGASIAGTSMYTSCYLSSSNVPASGQIYRWSPPQCSGSLSNLSATGNHSMVCPNGSAVLSLINSYTVSGIVYNWSWSTSSAVGPFTVIPNSNGAVYTATGINSPAWFINYASCLAGGAQTATSSVFGVVVAGTTTNSVPYYEDFEGITSNNELPNCSWMASSTPSVTQTYTTTMNQNRIARSGSKFGAFVAAYTLGTNYFYSNGIQLNSGVTYSATVWFTTDIYGYTNVTEFAMLYGTTQTTTGLVSIASQSPASSPVYKALTNTFQVPTSGIYYIAIKATSNGNYGTDYLSFDDLSITVPCSLNTPTVSMSISSQTICAGDQINLSATGADTFTWSNGATGASITDMPQSTTLYSVIGEDANSGCTSSAPGMMVTVNPSPQMFAYATNPVVCSGQLSNLVASGADTYLWNPGNSTQPVVAVNPTVSTSYIVAGTNSYGCTDTKTVAVTVNPLPIISSANAEMCKGETATLTASGGVSYTFASNASYVSGNPALVSPNITTTYTVTGTSTVGCVGKTTVVLTVDECLGIQQITGTLNGVNLYPNPTAGVFTVELNNTAAKTIQVTDISGRVISSTTSNNEKINMNVNTLANGIYYVKIQSDNAVKVIKLVKN